MKYQIDNITFEKVNGTGNEYVRLEMSDPDDMFNAPTSVASFDQNVINFYKRELQKANGVIDALPGKAKFFPYAVWVEVTLPEPMYRRWGREFTTTDKNGVQTVHQPDEKVCDKDGNPKLYTSFMILCKQTFDKEKAEMGFPAKECLSWAKGWDPVSRQNSYISAFFVRAEKATTADPTPQPAPQPQPGAPAPTAGVQQPTQGVQQPVQQAPLI